MCDATDASGGQGRKPEMIQTEALNAESAACRRRQSPAPGLRASAYGSRRHSKRADLSGLRSRNGLRSLRKTNSRDRWRGKSDCCPAFLDARRRRS